MESLRRDELLKFYFVCNPTVGGYMWGECLVHMARDQERYSSIYNRISGQIWDSAADITEIPVGMLSSNMRICMKSSGP